MISAHTTSRPYGNHNHDPIFESIPQAHYREPLLRVLFEHGPLPIAAVKSEIEYVMSFGPGDRQICKASVPLWVNRMSWERLKMVHEGLIAPPSRSGHGVWALTARGRRQARALLV